MKTVKAFKGAKIAALYQNKILVYKRDNTPKIIFPNYWDFPGGGRENNESPEACVLRELFEEFGLHISSQRLHYKKRVPSQTGIGYAYFFAVNLSTEESQQIRFGNEGQYWGWMDFQRYLNHESAIPANQDRLNNYLREHGVSHASLEQATTPDDKVRAGGPENKPDSGHNEICKVLSPDKAF